MILTEELHQQQSGRDTSIDDSVAVQILVWRVFQVQRHRARVSLSLPLYLFSLLPVRATGS